MTKSPPFDTAPMRYIQRIDRNHHAWKVTLRRKKRETHRYFSDQAYGGTPQALVAAMAWRDKMAAKLSGVDYAVWRRERVRPKNTPSAVGIRRGSAVQRTRSGGSYDWPYWQAHWTCADGTRGTRTFGVKKHGEERARELALAAREEAMRQLKRQFRTSSAR